MRRDGIRPWFMYGTAWKEDDTARCVGMALRAGFRAIDTANQRKHYHEAGVGQALAAAMADGLVTRDAVFLQTKFTFLDGQDHRLPYDPGAPVEAQVRQSFESSLEHLGVERIDSYVLHGPSRRHGWSRADADAWSAMERLHDEGLAGALGVSNVALDQLEHLCATARVPPAFVQNRCFAQLGWDRDIRAACSRHGITYQGFSLLTANVPVLRSAQVAEIARRRSASPAQVIFRFASQVGMLPLTGTTSAEHAALDLASERFDLDPAEVELLEGIAG